MARRTKDATGRVTPKGGPLPARRSKEGSSGPSPSATSRSASGSSTSSRSASGSSTSSRSASGSSTSGRPPSGRYTAPIPNEFRSSPRWVPILMLALFGLGLICILLNYLGALPGGASNGYLLVGLGLIILGFVAATQYR